MTVKEWIQIRNKLSLVALVIWIGIVMTDNINRMTFSSIMLAMGVLMLIDGIVKYSINKARKDIILGLICLVMAIRIVVGQWNSF